MLVHIAVFVYPAPHSCYALHNLLKPLQSTPNYFINDDLSYRIKSGVVARILTEGGRQQWPELSHQQCSAGESHCQTGPSYSEAQIMTSKGECLSLLRTRV